MVCKVISFDIEYIMLIADRIYTVECFLDISETSSF